MKITTEKMKAIMIGHAVGDAVGVPAEFKYRGTLDSCPVNDMQGFGTHNMPAGCWSDDTSMSLAALDSLSGGTVDFDDVMQKFGAWYYDSEYTATGKMFDVGITCSLAIDNCFNKHIPAIECGLSDERSNGNGSLMRVHPFVLYAYAKQIPHEKCDEMINTASALTHAHERSKLACRIHSTILINLLNEPSKDSIRLALERAEKVYKISTEIEHYKRIFDVNFAQTNRSEIKSSGYVVDTLEAALWCLLTTENYRDCVLKAVNLGEDTDTVAAIAGGLAGALYGYDEIPSEWKDSLIKRDYIEAICDKAYRSWCGE